MIAGIIIIALSLLLPMMLYARSKALVILALSILMIVALLISTCGFVFTLGGIFSKGSELAPFLFFFSSLFFVWGMAKLSKY